VPVQAPLASGGDPTHMLIPSSRNLNSWSEFEEQEKYEPEDPDDFADATGECYTIEYFYKMWRVLAPPSLQSAVPSYTRGLLLV